MAPELLRRQPPSEQSDLYAVGDGRATSCFGGRTRSTRRSGDRARPDPQDAAAAPRGRDRSAPATDPGTRLLAKQPEERFRDAGEVIIALACRARAPISIETVATRESFLEAAPFVGREHELARIARRAARRRERARRHLARRRRERCRQVAPARRAAHAGADRRRSCVVRGQAMHRRWAALSRVARRREQPAAAHRARRCRGRSAEGDRARHRGLLGRRHRAIRRRSTRKRRSRASCSPSKSSSVASRRRWS